MIDPERIFEMDFLRATEGAAIVAHRLGLPYGTDEAREGRDAFLEKRAPDWSGVPWHY